MSNACFLQLGLRSQTYAIANPTYDKVEEAASKQPSLKSATDSKLSVRYYKLEPRYYEIYKDSVFRYFAYYVLNQNSRVKTYLTLREKFNVVNGAVDSNVSSIQAYAGGLFDKQFRRS